MSLESASIRKNGQSLAEGLRVWINCREGEAGKKVCWGYMNPEWEVPIGRLDQDGDSRYELVLGSGEELPIRVWDHRDEYFRQFNQNGFRTVRFQTD